LFFYFFIFKKKDLSRTYPDHPFYMTDAPGLAVMRRVLISFSMHTPEIGYCQVCYLWLSDERGKRGKERKREEKRGKERKEEREARGKRGRVIFYFRE
jgi:Rab-GTPase-TBC domain